MWKTWYTTVISALGALGLVTATATKWGFYPIGLIVLLCAALVGLGMLFDGLRTLLHRPIVPEVMVQTYQTAGIPPLLWLAVVVAAPLGEETLFRGFLFKGILHSRLGGAGAILLTALIWAVLHRQYDLFDMANIFVAGLLFGYARLRSNSIYSGLLMHALMNLIATIQVVTVIWLAGHSG